MSVRTQRVRTKRKASAWRLSFTLVAILAFAISSFVTQTHVHHARGEHAFAAKAVDTQLANLLADGHSLDAKATKPEPKDPYTPNEDPANCPLCQELLHAGHYVAPAALLLFTPTAAPLGTVVFFHTAILGTRHISGWRSRAPPLV
jgi:hypothetical protein